MEKKVRDITLEKDERKEREDNLVIAGIPECSGTEEEQKNHDRDHIDAILKTAIGSIGENEDMKKNLKVTEVRRLGQKGIGTRPRMVKVQVKNKDIRNHILKNSYKNLQSQNRDTPNKDKIYINKDYTYAERQKQKELRDQLKAKKEETQENDWAIRGGEIVKRKVASGNQAQ